MSITPSKALFEALVPATLRGAAVNQAAMVKAAKPAAPAAVGQVAKPADLPAHDPARPLRRGSLLDISV